MSTSILQIISSCSVQKTTQKNSKYSRLETILKIDHHTKAIAKKDFGEIKLKRLKDVRAKIF